MHLPPEDDLDVSRLTPTPAARAAAGLVAMAGFLSLLSGVQLFLMVHFSQTWVALVPWAMIVLGAPTVYVGSQLYRMHAWAANVATGLMAVLIVGMGVWSVYAAGGGLFSCFTFLVPWIAIAGLGFAFRAGRDCQRADEVRERLRDRGMSLGV